RLQQDLTGTVVPQNLMRNRSTLQVQLDQILFGLFDSLAYGHGHFTSLAHAEPGMTLLIADDNERRKAEVLATFDDLGDALNGDHLVFQVICADLEGP